MNRCQVCDKTDEDDPKINIKVYDSETICLECYRTIQENLEDLSINDAIAIDYFDTYLLPPIVEDDSWVETPLPKPEVQE